MNQVSLFLPPLRERTEDIPLLAAHFVHKHAGILGFKPPTLDPDALKVLNDHSWPGNVRELENVIRQALLLTNGYPISGIDIREVLRKGLRASLPNDSLSSLVSEVLVGAEQGTFQDGLDQIIRRVEHEVFSQAMSRADGNQAKAARWLGISRVTLREKLRFHGLKAGPETAVPPDPG